MFTLPRKFYKYLTDEGAFKDGLTYANLPLTGAFMPILLIDIAYVLFVFLIGPWLMRNRPAFNLRKMLLTYNGIQIALNFYLAITGAYILTKQNFFDQAGCFLKLPRGHPLKYMEVTFCYNFYLTKFVDYTDTIFFVLRKSFKQVSFLHIYHHLVMTTATYLYIKTYGYGGHAITIFILNSLVHGFMYLYYFVSALHRDGKSARLWKKYITQLQILQFIILLIHQAWPLLFCKDCAFPKGWLVSNVVQCIIMIVLFGNFYRNAYLSQRGNSNTIDLLKTD